MAINEGHPIINTNKHIYINYAYHMTTNSQNIRQSSNSSFCFSDSYQSFSSSSSNNDLAPSLHPSYYFQEKDQQQSQLFPLDELKTLILAPSLQTNVHETYLSILYCAIIYVRKQSQRQIDDDGRLLDQIMPHVQLGSDPIPKSPVGNQLLKNGYFLAAYAILMGRIHHSLFLVEYLFNHFVMQFEVCENYQELLYYGTQRKMNISQFMQKSRKQMRKRKKTKTILQLQQQNLFKKHKENQMNDL